MAILVEWSKPYTAGDGIGIDADKIISVLLREENNLIKLNSDNELYTDLQLADGIEPDDVLPVWITVGKILEDDWWSQNWLLLNWKTTSWDYARWIYWADGKIYFDWWTGTWKQVYYSSDVDALFTAFRNELATVAFTGDYNDLRNRPDLSRQQPDWAQDDSTAPDYIKNKPTIGDATLTMAVNNNIQATFTANDTDNATFNVSVPTKTSDIQNDSGFIDKDVNNLTYYTKTSDLAAVSLSNSYTDLDNKPTIPVVNNATLTIQKNWTTVQTFTANASSDVTADISVPTVIDSLSSTDTTNSLSAYQWKVLNDKISDLQAMGKFLSLWDASTGLPISFPHQTPYTYSTWDYYLVETIASGSGTNYRPTGSSYTGTASTTAETDELEVWDLYIYDGSIWLLQINHWKTVSFANLAWQPSDNTALATALNAKADDNAVVKLTGNQTIAGTKTFSTSPVVPSKTSAATNSWTAIATEAQVYAVSQSIPASQVQSDWNQTTNTAVDYIKNKPGTATSSVKWFVKLWSDTVQSVAANSVTSEWSRTYAVQLNSNDQMVVNVPWTDTIHAIDDHLSTTSLNPVQNAVITTALNWKQATISNLSTIESWAAAWATAVQPWDLATVATTGSYTDLINQPTIPAVNNSTITFTQWGVSKGDITLNQSSAETIALDAGFAPSGTATTGYVLTKTSNWYWWAAPAASGIICDPNSPITITKFRAGTEAQYQALSSHDGTTAYLTI